MAETRGKVTIDNGSIRVGGKEVGRVDQSLKHGYHPAVLLTLGDFREWFEIDTPNLVDKVFAVVKEELAIL